MLVSLANLYNLVAMGLDLLNAYQNNDYAEMETYVLLAKRITESDTVIFIQFFKKFSIFANVCTII